MLITGLSVSLLGLFTLINPVTFVYVTRWLSRGGPPEANSSSRWNDSVEVQGSRSMKIQLRIMALVFIAGGAHFIYGAVIEVMNGLQ